MSKLHALPGKLDIEYRTIEAMAKLYCRHHHQHSKNTIVCDKCEDFLIYANEKLHRCPYGQNKPTCNRCPIHCYKKNQRLQAKEIMRYAGPRMLVWHPILAINHLLSERRSIPKTVPKNASNRHIHKTNL